MDTSWKCLIPNLLSFLEVEKKKLVEGKETTNEISNGETMKRKCCLFASQLNDVVYKLFYLLSQSEPPPMEVIGPVFEELEHFATKLILSFYSLPKTEGLTLHKIYHQKMINVTEDLILILRKIEEAEPTEEKPSIVYNLELTCAEFRNMPENNLEAVIRIIEDEEALVVDAFEEFSSHFELLKSEEESKSSPSSEELEVLPPALGLVKTGKCVLKKLKTALESNGKISSQEEISQLDKVASVIPDFSPAIDCFGFFFYTPCLEDASISNEVHTVITTTLNLIKNAHFMTDKDENWREFLLKAADHNYQKLNLVYEQFINKFDEVKLS